jgi:CBS domain-containing protein
LRVAETVGDIMDADAATVAPEDDVETVIRMLREHELPGLPVVNEGGRVVGMITESDLVLPDEDGDLHLPHYQRFEERLRKAFASKARDLMSEDPDTVSPETSVREAARLIHEKGYNRLPVVEHGRLVGVVTRVDILGALVA